jgi:uncharacterized protein (DUF924 family)
MSPARERELAHAFDDNGGASLLCMIDSEEVLSFWFEPRATSSEGAELLAKRWFGGGEALDHELETRFGKAILAARAGELKSWTESPRGNLALLQLLDQFPRNVFRGRAEAFASDEQALALSRRLIETGEFERFDVPERTFVSLPFSHAEDLEAQKVSVALSERNAIAAGPVWSGFMRGGVDFARKHLDVIARFGRFPHRNAALGRASTDAELQYLAYLEHVGQWL